jgi:hypothetical protein
MPPRKAARAAAPDGASDPKRVDLLGRQDRTEATLTLLSPQAAHTGVCVEPAVFDFHPGTDRVPVECVHRLRPEVVQEFAGTIAARSALRSTSIENPIMAAIKRERLPNRRLSETFDFECAGLRYTCTVGGFCDGRIAEIFLSNYKSNSAADTAARDAAIVASIALQFGANVETIRRALCRDSRGHASGPLGAALDILAESDRGS